MGNKMIDEIRKASEWIIALVEAYDASRSLVCPQDNHTLGCNCDCVVCQKRETSRKKLEGK